MKVKVNKLFIILMISSYLFAYIQGGNLPYTIFYGFLFIFAFALLSLYKYNKNIKVNVQCNKEIHSSGDFDEVAITLDNLGLLPAPNIIVKSKAISDINSNYNGDAVILMGDSGRCIKNRVEFKHRGIYDFGHIILESSDSFQIFKQTKRIYDKKITKVYPKTYNIENILLGSMDVFKNAQSRKSRLEDIYSVSDVRKYREGDNFKRIHWKLSAKCGELFVRNFDTVSGEESNIFLNMNIENMELDKDGILEEEMVDFCMSLINYMELREIKSKVFINSSLSRAFDIHSRNDVTALMEFFLKEISNAKENYVRFINSMLSGIPKLSPIMIIVGKMDEGLKNQLIIMKDLGYSIYVFYALESLQGKECINILKKIGIDCFKISTILNKFGE